MVIFSYLFLFFKIRMLQCLKYAYALLLMIATEDLNEFAKKLKEICGALLDPKLFVASIIYSIFEFVSWTSVQDSGNIVEVLSFEIYSAKAIS